MKVPRNDREENKNRILHNAGILFQKPHFVLKSLIHIQGNAGNRTKDSYCISLRESRGNLFNWR